MVVLHLQALDLVGVLLHLPCFEGSKFFLFDSFDLFVFPNLVPNLPFLDFFSYKSDFFCMICQVLYFGLDATFLPWKASNSWLDDLGISISESWGLHKLLVKSVLSHLLSIYGLLLIMAEGGFDLHRHTVVTLHSRIVCVLGGWPLLDGG